MWPTWSPSRWTRGRHPIGVGAVIAVETPSTRTPRPSARGPCWLLQGRLADRDQSSRTVPESMDTGRAADRDRVRISLDANSVSISTGTVLATCNVAEWSPSRWTRGRHPIGVGAVIAVETASTRILCPSARGPCWPRCNVADLVPKSMDTGKTSNRGRRRDRGRDSLDANSVSISTGTVLATLQCGRMVPKSMDTGKTSNRGRRRDRGRDSLDANSVSISTGTVLATCGPSR